MEYFIYKNGLNGKMTNALKSMYEAVKSKVQAGGDLTATHTHPLESLLEWSTED